MDTLNFRRRTLNRSSFIFLAKVEFKGGDHVVNQGLPNNPRYEAHKILAYPIYYTKFTLN